MPDLFGQDPWSIADTEAYLSDHPLPTSFQWRGRTVLPTYNLKKGYGFWLRTTPYHQGLFEEIHRLLARADYLPASGDDVAASLLAIERERGTQTSLFPDQPQPEPKP